MDLDARRTPRYIPAAAWRPEATLPVHLLWTVQGASLAFVGHRPKASPRARRECLRIVRSSADRRPPRPRLPAGPYFPMRVALLRVLMEPSLLTVTGGFAILDEQQRRLHQRARAHGYIDLDGYLAARGQQQTSLPQLASWAAKRQARLTALGFPDIEGYLRTRRVAQGWSLRRMAAELHLAPSWLKSQIHRLGIL